ncbi:MAG: M48 family metalloprotease [Mariprofundaceae bacterium]
MTTAFALIAIAALSIALHLLWAWRCIHAHPHVEPAYIAIPEIEPYLSRMIKDISKVAEITPPELFVCRARLPNAFVIVTIMRSELFITDELLEEANNQQHKLDYLTSIICHEIAHLKNQDSIKLGLITYMNNISACLHFRFVEEKCDRLISLIEQRADLTASDLFKEYSLSLSDNDLRCLSG